MSEWINEVEILGIIENKTKVMLHATPKKLWLKFILDTLVAIKLLVPTRNIPKHYSVYTLENIMVMNTRNNT